MLAAKTIPSYNHHMACYWQRPCICAFCKEIALDIHRTQATNGVGELQLCTCITRLYLKATFQRSPTTQPIACRSNTIASICGGLQSFVDLYGWNTRALQPYCGIPITTGWQDRMRRGMIASTHCNIEWVQFVQKANHDKYLKFDHAFRERDLISSDKEKKCESTCIVTKMHLQEWSDVLRKLL